MGFMVYEAVATETLWKWKHKLPDGLPVLCGPTPGTGGEPAVGLGCVPNLGLHLQGLTQIVG
jgi:hypothetical protein